MNQTLKTCWLGLGSSNHTLQTEMNQMVVKTGAYLSSMGNCFYSLIITLHML